MLKILNRIILCEIIERIFFLVFLIFSTNSVISQDNSTLFSDYSTFLQVKEFIERKHNVILYYKGENFLNIKFHNSIKELSLNEVLSRIEEISNSYSLLIDNYIVLLPKSEQQTLLKSDGLKFIQIGNQSDYGKNSKAIVRGRVVDAKTGEPLIGAIVYSEGFKQGTSTNMQGEYSLQIPVGNQTLKISYIGFEDALQSIMVYSSGIVDFELFEKSVNIDGVYVYSDGPDHNVTRTQMSVDRINSKGIKELPLSVGEIDVIKSFTLLPGVQSVGEFGAGFNVRGGGVDQNLILIEEVPLFNTSHLFGLTSIINSDAVNNVTLIKAGIPAKYGERASSVMNIKMNNVSDNKFKMKAGIGLLNSKVFMEIPLLNNRISFSFGGRTSYSNWLLKEMPDVDLMNSSAKFYDLNGILTLNLDEKNKISIFGYRSFDFFDYRSSIEYNYTNSLGSLKWFHTINKNLSFTLIVGLSNYRYEVTEIDSSRLFEASKVYSSLDYRMFKGNLLYTPNRTHSIEFGVNAFQYIVKPGRIEPYSDKSLIIASSLNTEKALESGIYISDNITVSPKFGIDLGLRYSHFMFLGPGREFIFEDKASILNENIVDTLFFSNNKIIKTYDGFEPRINVRYMIDDSKSLKMSFSQINQYVNLISVTSSIAPSDIWKLSNKYLKPLKSNQFSIGYFNNFLDNSIEASIEVYYKRIENSLEYKNGVKVVMNPNIESALIRSDGLNYGIEFYLKKTGERLGGWISYTLSKSIRKTSGNIDEEVLNNNNYFPSNYDKTHNLIVNSNIYLSRRWRFAATFTYNTGRPITLPEYEYYLNGYKYIYYSDRNKYRLPDYHRLDLSITLGESLRVKKKWKGSFTFSVINIYGRKNAYTVFYQRRNSNTFNSNSDYNLYKLYIMGRPFPTLTYNIAF